MHECSNTKMKTPGMRIKRLWSFRDQSKGGRYYADILEMPEADRKRLLRQYVRFQSQLRSVRKAMADYFAGQRFFDFYTELPDEDEVEHETTRAAPREDSIAVIRQDRTKCLSNTLRGIASPCRAS